MHLVSEAGVIKGVGEVAGVGKLREVRGDVLGCLLSSVTSGLGHIIQLTICLAGSIEAWAMQWQMPSIAVLP